MENKQLKITAVDKIENKSLKLGSNIDYDDLSLYGIEVVVDLDNGDVTIERNGREIVSVSRNQKTEKIEVKRRIEGEMQVVLNDLLLKLNEILEKMKEPLPKEELDIFFF